MAAKKKKKKSTRKTNCKPTAAQKRAWAAGAKRLKALHKKRKTKKSAKKSGTHKTKRKAKRSPAQLANDRRLAACARKPKHRAKKGGKRLRLRGVQRGPTRKTYLEHTQRGPTRKTYLEHTQRGPTRKTYLEHTQRGPTRATLRERGLSEQEILAALESPASLKAVTAPKKTRGPRFTKKMALAAVRNAKTANDAAIIILSRPKLFPAYMVKEAREVYGR